MIQLKPPSGFSLLVAGLLVVGFLLRIVFQPAYPQGFHRDEAVITYDAYSILTTGRDSWGTWFPLHFRSFGDYPPGIYNYLVAASIAVVGFGELAARLPAIIAGTLLIPISYWLVKKWLGSPQLGLGVAFLMTISPWDIVQSRAGSEAIVGLLFFLVCWGLVLNWATTRHARWLWLSVVTGFLALFSYNAIKLGLPLLFSFLLIGQWTKLESKKLLLGWLSLWWLLGVGSVFLTQGTAMSLQSTSVLTTQETGSLTVAFIREGHTQIPVVVSRTLHNHLTNLGQNVARNYASYFTPDFLFWQGGFPGRYRIPLSGLLYFSLAPCLLISLVFSGLLTPAQKKIVVGWLILAPVVAAITNTDVPHVKRALFLFFPLYLLAVDGWWTVFQWLKPKIFKSIFVLATMAVLSWEGLWFGVHYVAHTNYETIHHRSFGWKEVFLAVNQLQNQYQKISIFEDNDAPYIFYLFYSHFPPQEYQKLSAQNPGNIFRADKQIWHLNQLTFLPGACPEQLEPGVLYVSPALRCTDLWEQTPHTVIGQVIAPDGTPKFVWYTLKTN